MIIIRPHYEKDECTLFITDFLFFLITRVRILCDCFEKYLIYILWGIEKVERKKKEARGTGNECFPRNCTAASHQTSTDLQHFPEMVREHSNAS